MKRFPYALITLALTIPVFASYEDQSYLSYDSGDTVVVQGIDNREIEVGVNSPVFAGDQVVTGRRGRVEIRLADGNVVALDSRTALLFHAMQGSYESEDQQTIAELIRGKLIVHHNDDDHVPVRIDTRSASYHSLDQSILSIETDGYRDEVSVFGGLVEVRTREGSYRLRTGERVFVGEKGIYESSGLARDGMDDFERWYMRRSDDTRGYQARYIQGRNSYAEPILDVYGSWVYVQDYGDWVWRPRVSVGWKPYHNGYWRR
ncbi:MAG: FecR domain-containing protein, partial [Acidobacteria bacterium]|nr:FecR domain-containing protein [Acidobacteriota bacterium]